MAMTNAAKALFLNHLLNNAAWANVGDVGGLLPSSANGDNYLSLHIASPGATGTQSTNETTYGAYVRVPAVRDGTFWTVVITAENAADIDFAVCASGGPVVITHVGVGSASAGAGHLHAYGALASPVTINNGDPPQFAAGQLTVDIT